MQTVGLGRTARRRVAICSPFHVRAANERARKLHDLLLELEGRSSREIAAELNRRCIPSATGKKWHGQTILRVLLRLQRDRKVTI